MRPLEGVTVLDLTRVVAGPYATMIMADLGARVIKIENPRDPDYTRDFEPYLIDDDKRQSAFFAQYNRNKEAITLNLKEEKAKEIFRELAKKADIVVENYRAGVMDKLGVGYEDLRRYNPKLVYTAISGFGQKGPYSSWPAYDNSGQALSGLWSLNGMPGEPTRIGTIIGDLAATFFGTIGTLAAYIHAQKTGKVIFCFAASIVGMIAYVFLHEGIHGIFIRLLTGTSASFGLDIKHGMAHASSSWYFRKWPYIIIALSCLLYTSRCV